MRCSDECAVSQWIKSTYKTGTRIGPISPGQTHENEEKTKQKKQIPPLQPRSTRFHRKPPVFALSLAISSSLTIAPSVSRATRGAFAQASPSPQTHASFHHTQHNSPRKRAKTQKYGFAKSPPPEITISSPQNPKIPLSPAPSLSPSAPPNLASCTITTGYRRPPTLPQNTSRRPNYTPGDPTHAPRRRSAYSVAPFRTSAHPSPSPTAMNGAPSPEGIFREEYSDAPNVSSTLAHRHATAASGSTDTFGVPGSSPARFDSALPHTNSMLDSKVYRDSTFNENAAFPPSDDGLLLMDGLPQDYLSWTSQTGLGSFRQDAMDMDQSPGLESGMYVDSVSALAGPLRPDDGSFMQFVQDQNPDSPQRFSLDQTFSGSNGIESQLHLQLLQQESEEQARLQQQQQKNLQQNLQHRFQQQRSRSNTHNLSVSQLSVESHPAGRTNLGALTPKNYDSEPFSQQQLSNGRDPSHSFSSGISPARAFGSLGDEGMTGEPGSVEAFNSLPNRTPDADNYSHHTRSRRNTQSLAASYGDFSPLTTTTSLTPSLNSVHSTQQSFFSASQFNRSSFEQPPSSIQRPSFDVYPRGRVSIDSQGSSIINPPARNPRSFSSYIPFMGERDRERNKQPSPEWAQSQQPQQQSRHLIRSIFKSNQEQNDIDPAPFLADVLVDNDAMEIGESNLEENPLPSKKPKRTRMNLFNRFKSGKTAPSDAQQQDAVKSELVKLETRSSAASSERDDSSFQTSSVVQHSLQNSVRTANSSNSGHQQAPDVQPSYNEPDYASLFENVGKRRLGGMKNKRPQVKQEKQESEQGLTSSTSATDKSSLNADKRLSTEHSDSGHSMPLSQHSSMSEEPFTPATSSSTFANASKRILGSRLLKKKSQQAKSEPQADLVEIDLSALDLPPDTEIIPTINPKVRTRGRKEDKAADMNDSSKIFVCTFCSRRFKRQEHLKRHFRSLHTAEKPYECPTCFKKFSRTDNLNQHIKVHKQEEEEARARAAGLLAVKEENDEPASDKVKIKSEDNDSEENEKLDIKDEEM